ncbi:MAG: MFS transporter [Candidatus Latescibacterota bacterium]|nr:MFS transporter [Candidatus Latescibacterota bacterium]
MFGSADFGIAATESVIQIYLLKFYSESVGLSATWVGFALAVAMLWDALSDPVMGGISDRTKHAQGRRRPFFIPGTITLAVTFVLLFNPPNASNTTIFFYLVLVFLSLNTAMTLVSVPHTALAGEISSDRHERSKIFGFKRFFSTFGALLGLILPALLMIALERFDIAKDLSEYSKSASTLIIAPIIIATGYISFYASKSFDRSKPKGQKFQWTDLGTLLMEQREVMKNPLFRILLLAFAIAAVGRTLNASIALYYYEYFLLLNEKQVVVFILLPFFLCLVASVPFWIWLAKKWGKKNAALLGIIALGCSTTVVYPLMPSGLLIFPLLNAVVGGFMAGAIVLMDSLVADSIDYDRLRVPYAREGLYFGVWKMITKISRAVGLLIAGIFLDCIGFAAGTKLVVSDVSYYISLIFGPVVGILFITAGVVLWTLPLDNKLHDRIQRIIQRRWGKSNQEIAELSHCQ